MAKSSSSAFTGGKLSLKGDKKKPKKKTKTLKHHGKGDDESGKTSAAGRSHHDDNSDDGDVRTKTNNDGHDKNSSDDEDLTAAEKRSRKFKQQRERKELVQIVRCVT